MFGHNRGHNALQIVSWIVFDHALLHRMAHDLGQILAYPTSDVMHAFIVNRFNQLCQMAGFNMGDIHRSQSRGKRSVSGR